MKNRASLFASTAALAIVTAVCPVHAQDTNTPQAAAAPASTGGLQEIVVTAEKKSENLQKTPAAVVPISSEQLAQVGIIDTRGLVEVAPSAHFGEQKTGTQIYIRGVGQDFDTPQTAQGVAVYENGGFLPENMAARGLFDIASVEVLPGPQGTLWGRNTPGGAISIVTNRPTDQYEATARLEAGNYAEFHTDATLNVPVTDDFKVRLAIDSNRHDGYLSNGEQDLDAMMGRLSVLWTPTENLSIYGTIDYYHDGGIGDGTVAETPKPPNPWYSAENTATGDFFNKRQSALAVGEIKYSFGDGYNLTDIPEHLYLHDNLISIALPGYRQDSTNEWQWSDELRLDNNAQNGPLKFVAGLYWYDFGASYLDQNTPIPILSNPANWLNPSIWPPFQLPGASNSTVVGQSTTFFPNINDTSYAAFGQATYSLFDWLRLTGGLRFTSDELTAGNNAAVYYSGNRMTNALTANPGAYFVSTPFAAKCTICTGGVVAPGGIVTPAAGSFTVLSNPFTFDTTWKNVDWKLGVEADVTDKIMTYANLQTGFLEGGFTPIPATQNAGNAYQPEKLLALTVGVKSRFFNDHVQFNDEAFWYDYKDLQVNAFNPALNTSTFWNVNKTVIYGDQIDAKWLITEDDQFGASISVMSAHYADFRIPTGPGGAMQSYDGYQAQYAPYATITLNYDHTFELASGARVVGHIDTYYDAGDWQTYTHTSLSHDPQFTVTNLQLMYYSSDDKWYVGLWVRNIENSGELTTVLPTAATPTTPAGAQGFPIPPRTYGGTIGAKF